MISNRSVPNTPLFNRFPQMSTRLLANGTLVPVPYHIYDGFSSMVAGFCAANKAQAICAQQGVEPILTESGRALMLVSFWNFTEANLGAHTELQYSLLVTVRGRPLRVPDHPLAPLLALYQEDGCFIFISQLYNDSPLVVAYNREAYYLNADLCTGTLAQRADARHYHFETPQGEVLVTATLPYSPRPSLGVAWQLWRQMGSRQLREITAAPYLGSVMINRVTERPESWHENMQAMSYLKTNEAVLRWFGGEDRLRFGSAAGEMGEMGFEGTAVAHYDGIQFVYVQPHNKGQ